MTSENISREDQRDVLEALKRNSDAISTLRDGLDELIVELEGTDAVQEDDLARYRARMVRLLNDSKKHLLERNALLRRSLDLINDIKSRKPNIEEGDRAFLDTFVYLRDTIESAADALIERYQTSMPLVKDRLC